MDADKKVGCTLVECLKHIGSCLFRCIPEAVDRWSRYRDRDFGSIYSGPGHRWPDVHGHPAITMILMFPVLYYLSFGPTLDPFLSIFSSSEVAGGWRSVALLGVLMAAYAVLFLAIRHINIEGSRLWWLQVGVMIIVAVIAFFGLAAPSSVEGDDIPYRHFLTVIFLLVMVYAGAGSLLAVHLIFRNFPNEYAQVFSERLKSTELFVYESTPPMGVVRVFHGLLNGPLYNPFHFLFLPAVVALVLPRNNLYNLLVIAAVFVSWMLVTWGAMYYRWHNMIDIVRRWFFVGGQLVISMLVIALAAVRLLNVDYVATVLDSTPWGNLTVVSYLFAAYGILWLYEYWINWTLLNRLLKFLGTPLAGFASRISYPFSGKTNTTVNLDNRVLQIHGGSRFIVIGDLSNRPHGAFHSYDKGALFQKLADNTPTTEDETHDRICSRQAINALNKRIKLYFTSLNVVAVALLGVGLYVWDKPEDIKPIVLQGEIVVDGNDVGVDLLSRLKQQQQASRPAIAIAASGGGTRAALYTASLLRGLSELGVTDNIVLTSGVSGGGVALAYYAAHYPIEQDDKSGWNNFSAAMAEPFIQDVIQGMAEYRIFSNGTRWSQLLAESFQRRLMTGQAVKRKLIGELNHHGLVLNTTLAGHPCGDSELLQELFKSGKEEPCLGVDDQSYSVHAGARLIFTNLKNTASFPVATTLMHSRHSGDEYLKYIIVRGDQVPLATGAALNANFPPVFSEAGVFLSPESPGGKPRKYWVTDGGAADNRGMVSLLYALLSALEEGEDKAIELPDLHIVMAEASAGSIDYKANRGIGAKFGAAEKFASQLMEELLARLTREYRRVSANPEAKVHLHYLAMPAALRIRGGLGTHWMMPPGAYLMEVTEPDPDAAEEYWVEREDLERLIVQLHELGERMCPGKGSNDKTSDLAEVESWMCNDPHRARWLRLSKSLDFESTD